MCALIRQLRLEYRRVVAFYNKRGTCEQWIKEGKGAIKWTRLSCRTFAANAVRPASCARLQSWQLSPHQLHLDEIATKVDPGAHAIVQHRSRSKTGRCKRMSVWNGHYACACYHPLFVFNQFGDLERCALRPGGPGPGAPDNWPDELHVDGGTCRAAPRTGRVPVSERVPDFYREAGTWALSFFCFGSPSMFCHLTLASALPSFSADGH